TTPSGPTMRRSSATSAALSGAGLAAGSAPALVLWESITSGPAPARTRRATGPIRPAAHCRRAGLHYPLPRTPVLAPRLLRPPAATARPLRAPPAPPPPDVRDTRRWRPSPRAATPPPAPGRTPRRPARPRGPHPPPAPPAPAAPGPGGAGCTQPPPHPDP